MDMAFDSFTKKPFKDRLKDTGFLIKNSFTIVGKNKNITTPTVHMAVLTAVITILLYSALLTFVLGQFILLGLVFLFFAVFILVPFRFFYDVRQKANQSWIVYNTICGKNITYSDAHQYTRAEKGKLRVIALVDAVMAYANSQKRNRRGVLGVVIGLFLGFLNQVWDLLSHYMLPAVVIEQKSLKEVVPEIKSLKNNVPATLTGVFGIDFVGNVIRSLFWGVFTVFAFLSLGVGYLIGLFTEVTVVTVNSFSFSWVPPFVLLLGISVVGGIYKKIIESIKVIYFTIFYTSIMHPMNISESLRGELTNYLLMKESDFAPTPQPDPHEQYISRLSEYIKQYESSGYSEQQIKDFLLSKGYPQKDVELAVEKSRS